MNPWKHFLLGAVLANQTKAALRVSSRKWGYFSEFGLFSLEENSQRSVLFESWGVFVKNTPNPENSPISRTDSRSGLSMAWFAGMTPDFGDPSKAGSGGGDLLELRRGFTREMVGAQGGGGARRHTEHNHFPLESPCEALFLLPSFNPF